MDSRKTLELNRDNKVKHSDIVSGDEPIEVMVRVTGGRNDTICPGC